MKQPEDYTVRLAPVESEITRGFCGRKSPDAHWGD